jgi:MFS family permease
MNSNKHIFTLLICLYFTQGLPSGLLAHALPALMRSYEVDLRWISLLKLLAIPWFLKFLWSPYIDQYWQRRQWIMLFQSGAICILLLLSMLNPETIFSDYLFLFMLLVFLLNAFSASQDIASDGIAVQEIPTQQLGWVNSIQVSAYKIGLIGGGTALLILLDTIGWQYSLQCFAGLLLLALIPVLLYKNDITPTSTNPLTKTSFKNVFLTFIDDKNMWLWLAIIATYKMADGLGSAMIKPMLIDHGLSLSDVGYLTSISSIAGITGAVLGGFLFPKLSLKQALIGFSVLQSIGIGLLAFIPLYKLSIYSIYALSLFEQFADGLSTVTLFAAMMMHCRKGLEGTDYTLQNSIHLIGAGTASILSGIIAESIGYSWLFITSLMLGLLSLLLIMIYPNGSIRT